MTLFLVQSSSESVKLKYKIKSLTVHHMESLTPAALMPGNPGLHTGRKRHIHYQTSNYYYCAAEFAAYITHVVVPRAGDLR